MPENANLRLDFEEAGAREGKEQPLARVCVDSAWSYLKESGAPVVSRACRTLDELEEEVERLKEELDGILGEARRRFGADDRLAPPAGGGESPGPPVAPGPAKRLVLLGDDLRVRDRMTRDVKTLGPNDKIRLADELMKVGRFRHIVVLDDSDQQVIGVLSQTDICFSALVWTQGMGKTAHERALEAFPVKHVMQSSVTTIAPEATLAEAARRMRESKIGCLPVVEKNRLVGIITEGDFLALVTDASRQAGDPKSTA